MDAQGRTFSIPQPDRSEGENKAYQGRGTRLLPRDFTRGNRQFVFNDDEKERFRKIMRAVVT
jgi:hypothetical protein